MDSDKLSEHLEAIARLMELDGENVHRVNAFRRAAKQVLGRSAEELREPRNLPGIGPSIAAVVREFGQRSSSARLEELSSRWTPGVISLMSVRGIGARTAVKLVARGIDSIPRLRAALERGELSRSLAESVQHSLESMGPLELMTARKIVDSTIVPALLASGAGEAIGCGSLRRARAQVNDIDVVARVGEEDRSKVLRTFESLGRVLTSGPNRSSVSLPGPDGRVQCDLWLVDAWCWGAALNHATGSRRHNERLRGLAKCRGLRLNEFGVWRPLGDASLDVPEISFRREGAFSPRGEMVAERLGGESEEDAYSLLGLRYVEPTARDER